jgi:polysaccharide biosynthesis transport protein
MINTNQRLVTPRDVARILFRQWRKIALFCGVVMGLTLIVICLYPRLYASEAKLLIRIGRESVGLDPTATTGETIMLQKSQDDEVNSAINILSSREVLEGVVEQVGASRILEDRRISPVSTDLIQTAASSGGWIGSVLQTIGLSDPGTEVDRAIRRLEGKLVVGSQKQSMVITVNYAAASPELAHDIVDAITKVFLREHSRLNHQDGSLEFFAEQAENLHADLTAAQAKLRDRKNAYQTTSSTGRQSVPEKAKDALLQNLYDLQLQESKFRSEYTDAYPPLQEIQRERQKAEEMLGQMSGNGLPSLTDIDPKKATPTTDVQTLNNQEFELAQLGREVTLLEGKYKMHVEKLEQARVNDALGREQITNVKVAQPATLVHKPISPNKILILGLGLLVSSFGGIGLAFLCEQLDQTLRTTDQVEAKLGLPVLASLPQRSGRKLRSELITKLLDRFEIADSLKPTKSRRANYHGLLTALQSSSSNGDRHAKTVGVIGCETFKMRSWVAGNIAIQAASSGDDSVLLIDADARRRRVAKRFELNGGPGWSELLAGSAVAENCVKWSTPEKLAIMGPGYAADDCRAANSALGNLGQVDGIKSKYGLVVVDLPSTREQEGPPAAAEWIDEMVLVVEAERTRIQAALRAKDMLDRAGIRLTGVVLANRREHIPHWLYQRL